MPNEATENQELFRFADPRQERIHKRLAILGSGAAEFFYDACRLMITRPLFKSTTHLVSHLIREIESSLRDVLEPLRLDTEPIAKNSEDKHKAEIKAILKALGIPETEPVAELWLSFAGKSNERGLHAWAHRDSLEAARPFDERFVKVWEDVQAVLDSILDKFEARYLESHRVLDEFVRKESPTTDDAKWIKTHVPNTQTVMWDFFGRLQHPAWIAVLEEEGFFKHPYPPAPDEHGNLAHTHWPHSKFLSRMAQSNEEGIRESILTIFMGIETENISIHEDRIEAALSMPASMASKVAEKECLWIRNQLPLFGRYPDQISKLISHLASDGQSDSALGVLRCVIEIGPDPRESNDEETRKYWHPRPQTKINDWEYKVILNNVLPTLVAAAPLEALTLFCEALETAVRLSRRPGEREPPDDGSDRWREYLESSSRDGIENVLVSVVRKVAKQVAEHDSKLVPEVVRILESREWLIFKRLAFHVLNLHPISDLVIDRLMDRSNYDQRGLFEQYIELLKNNLQLLDENQQNEILGWMDENVDIALIKKNSEEMWGEVLSDDEARRRIVHRKLRRFTPLKDVLPERWRKRYEGWLAMVASQGLPAESASRIETTWGLDTPKSREELAKMSVENIVSFIKDWKRPEDSSDLRQPSPEALGRELTAAVSADAERFARKADHFVGLKPTYVRSMLAGLRTAANEGAVFSWAEVLNLCEWVLEQAIAETEPDLLEDQGWSPTRAEILRLISIGLENRRCDMPYEMRSQVWKLLEVLCNDIDPTPESEASRGEDTDFVDLGNNSVRGDAIQTVIRYALWTKRHLEATTNQPAEQRITFEGMPEVRATLENHLDVAKDPSLAIRSIYGRWIPWLVSLDSDWVTRNVNLIFPKENGLEKYYTVAWESYVGWSPAYEMVLPILGQEYAAAIDRIGIAPGGEGRARTNPDERLAEHLMILYARGAIKLDDGGLMIQFFEKASPGLRAHAIWSIGSGFSQTKDEIAPQLLERIKILWMWRLEQGKTNIESNRNELQQFGWIFISGKLDDEWCLTALRDTLRISSGINADSQVVETLAKLAPANLTTAVDCLRLVIDSIRDHWKISYWDGHIRSILSAALQGDDFDVAENAKDLVNRLAARGNRQFETLLPARAVKYFAYGSNMLTKRLRQRTPSARFSAVTKLTQHVLRFHKRSEDKTGHKSGKCNAYFTGDEKDYVYGVVFDIDRNEKDKLVEVEGGYVEEKLTLTSRDGKSEAAFMFNVADRACLDDELRPYDWYKALVLAGAKEHNFPEEYLREIDKVATIRDPNKDRNNRNRRFLR
jgi:AIG2 family protein